MKNETDHIYNITFGYLFFWLRDNKCHIFRCILQNFNCSMVADPLQTHTIHRYQTVSCKNRQSSSFKNKEKFMLNLRNVTAPFFLFCPSSTFIICANSCLSVKYLGNYLICKVPGFKHPSKSAGPPGVIELINTPRSSLPIFSPPIIWNPVKWHI